MKKKTSTVQERSVMSTVMCHFVKTLGVGVGDGVGVGRWREVGI